MGGEAIKALQIFQELKKREPQTIQITHERNRAEVSGRLKLENVFYIKDTIFAIFLWRSRIFSKLLDAWFCRKAVTMAEEIAQHKRVHDSKVIIHQTEPNSPVTPRTISRRHINVFGPINGNIYYPPIFRRYESTSARLRRYFHMPLQRLNSLLFRGLTKADMILCAGGNRTRQSLLVAGCSPQILHSSLDCGIRDELLDMPRIEHRGENLRFVHYGRTFHKGTFLVIEALARTKRAVAVDIIGQGPEIERCKKLAAELGVNNRVRFLGWYDDHKEFLKSLGQYRGGLLPTLEDANGIVVQEGMALGLPMICLDWGGPQLLIQHGISGYLIEPISQEHIVTKIAEYLDNLSSNADCADRMSVLGRKVAQDWRWSVVVNDWIGKYRQLPARSTPRKLALFQAWLPLAPLT